MTDRALQLPGETSEGTISVPVATQRDISRAFSSAQPLREIEKRLVALREAEQAIGRERSKWEHARGVAELLSAGEQEAGASLGQAERKAPEPIHSANGGDPGLTDEPKNRPEAVLRVLREQPRRVWRTAELHSELERRGWQGQSRNPSKVSQALAELTREGLAFKIGKGRYKLAREVAAS